MAKEIKWTPEKVRYIQWLARNQDCISLSTIVSDQEDNGDTELGALIPDTSPTPEEISVDISNKEYLRKVFNKYLSPREEKVILMRYGFITGNAMTLDEVGKEFGVTRERIRQVEYRAIQKLKLKVKKEELWN